MANRIAQNPRRVEVESRIDSAATVESALGIALVEVVNHVRDLHAFVLVRLVLKKSFRQQTQVPHQALANKAARVGKSTRKLLGPRE